MAPTSCPVCESSSPQEFLCRHSVPVFQNMVMPDQVTARGMSRGELRLMVCRACGFVFNAAFDPEKVRYCPDYDNTQTCSHVFQQYVESLVRNLVQDQGVRNSRIVEIGCGKGGFLRLLVEHEGGGNQGIGFDPSYVGPSSELDGRLRFENRYYDERSIVPADVVVCRHVIEHVPNPVSLLQTIRRALTDSPRARLFFETPCVEWILRNQVVWDFFYEHCSYFNTGSLRTAFEVAGFHVDKIIHLFAGQYLWAEASLGEIPTEANMNPGLTPDLARDFGNSEKALCESWRKATERISSSSKLALWGAGAKGVTFANLVDPDCRYLVFIVDMNPKKQGCFLAGTGHLIVPHQKLATEGVNTALVLNPNYRKEIVDLLKKEGLDVNVIDLMELEPGK